MTEKSRKSFDCVQAMREARDGIDEKIAKMSYAEMLHWLRSRHYEDPRLQELAEEAARRAEASERPVA